MIIMKILYINDALAIYGGLERILVDKMNWLSGQDNMSVFFVTVNQGDHKMPFFLNSKVIHFDLGVFFQNEYRYKGIRRLLTHWKLWNDFKNRFQAIVRRVEPDIILCSRINFIKTILKVKGNIPLIYESHTSCKVWQFEEYGFLKRKQYFYHNHSVKYTQAVVALTEGDAKEWKKHSQNVRVIPNIVHLNDSHSFSDCMLKSAIFVGRFSKQKDIISLLNIWSIVHQRHPDWQLQLFGGYGEDQDRLMNTIDKMSINIVVHNTTSQIIEEYKKNSILLVTSLYEPFGLVMPEAMSCGIPVVAFDCPYGPREIIEDNITGFLIPHRNINQFADKVCQLIENRQLRCKMGSNAIKASQNYVPELIMPLWVNLFSELKNDII